MTTTPMPIQRVRVHPTDWADLETAAPHGNRSSAIRDLIAWYLRRPGAELPERPPRPDPGGCGKACVGGHRYEGECLVSPMIIGTISPVPDADQGGYAWRCNGDSECKGLLHLGYASTAAARRAYDRHLITDHPA